MLTIYEICIAGVWMPLAKGPLTIDGRTEDWLYVPGTFHGVTIRMAERGLAEGWIRERPALKSESAAAPAAAPEAEAAADLDAGSFADCPAGHQLHIDMARAGIRDHAGFASGVLGRRVHHLRYLSRSERNAIRAAMADQQIECAAEAGLLPI